MAVVCTSSPLQQEGSHHNSTCTQLQGSDHAHGEKPKCRKSTSQRSGVHGVQRGRQPLNKMDIRKFFAAKAGLAKAGPTKAPLPAKKKFKVGFTSVRSAPQKTVRQPVASADLQDEEGLSDYEKVIT